MRRVFWIQWVVMLLVSSSILAQSGKLSGTVSTTDGPLEFASVYLEGYDFGMTTNKKGYFEFDQVPLGNYTLVASYVGFDPVQMPITITEDKDAVIPDILLSDKNMVLDAIVITGTKTFKRQTNSPVIVNVINSKTLSDVQACNLSEGLKFQPGLRVETDCQTCNYTQLRMNGLGGGYSQILINGRPVFSPLTGLYGMEQLPTNMIERIEVIRGGGSSLYGSSAIGGTVNVITRIPRSNGYELNYNYQNINGQADDHQVMGNATVISENRNAGLSFFLNRREREFYDHNDDNFSEIPLIENTSVGANLFFLPTENQKLELSLSNLNEYRLGGEMVDLPAYLAQQSEERTHQVWMANMDYQINFNDQNSSLISYLAWQNTGRSHYTGIIPDEPNELRAHYEDPPYGTSEVKTINAGVQLNHRLSRFLNGENRMTLGAEYIWDDVYDEIPSYRYLIDQTTKNLGVFLQSDWELVPNLSLLSGVRMDIHNLIDDPLFNPRVSLLYKWRNNTQFRLNYGTGFRAPQAFDTDLHIAFAGGGVSRVSLSPDLLPEKSQSYSASVNYDKPMDNYIVGFTLEGFYTRLKDAFILQPIGEDSFGEQFEKQNGQEARVGGTTIELRANYARRIQLEAGLTLQTSEFKNRVEYIDGVEGIREFIRTPNEYGFATLNITPNNRMNANINYVYTGSMKVPHFAGAPNQDVDEIIDSPSFHEVNTKIGYTIPVDQLSTGVELYGGVKNVFNAYQEAFDIGKNRDSNFVYGPAQPRTFFIGIKLSSL